jgi:nicotinate phosphoribosyltransferase
MKLSRDKITLPGRKQVYRFSSEDGTFRKDMIALADEKVEGEPLLVKVMEKGELTYSLPSIDEIRDKAAESLRKLPFQYQELTGASVYPVYLSQKLQDLIEKTKGQLTKNEINNVTL